MYCNEYMHKCVACMCIIRYLKNCILFSNVTWNTSWKKYVLLGNVWHHVFIKVIMVIHKYYYFDCNGTGTEYIESEGTHAVGKYLCYAFIKI